MSRVENIFPSGNTKFDDPALQDAKCNQNKRNKGCCLNIVHRNGAGRRNLSAFYGRAHIGIGKGNHIQKEDQLNGVVDNLDDCLSPPWKDGNKLFDFNG